MPRSAGSETSEKSSSEISAKNRSGSADENSSISAAAKQSVLCTEVFDENSSPSEDGKLTLGWIPFISKQLISAVRGLKTTLSCIMILVANN